MQLQKTEYLRISMDIYGIYGYLWIHDCMINDTTSTGDVAQRPKIWTMSTAFHHIRGILDTWYIMVSSFSTFLNILFNVL